MKMALKDGQVLIKEADNNQFLIIKSWSKMRWDKGQQDNSKIKTKKLLGVSII